MKIFLLLPLFILGGCKAQQPCFNFVNGVKVKCTTADSIQRAAYSRIGDSLKTAQHLGDSLFTIQRNFVLSNANSAVGIKTQNWTNAQTNSILTLMLWNQNGINNSGVLDTLGNWVKPIPK